MRVAAPRPTWLDLRWRMFGAPFRVHFLFWPAAAALGWGWHAGPSTWGNFLLWIPCVLICLIIHEIGHVLAARYLGYRPEAVFYLLGSLTAGLEEVQSRWKRIVIFVAGPLATGLFLLALWGLSVWLENHPLPFAEWMVPFGNALVNVVLFNWWWLLLNVIPLWPLDMGRILGVLVEGLGKPARGGVLGVCLFTAFALAYVSGLFLQESMQRWRMTPLFVPDKDKYELLVQEYSIAVLFCVLFMARTFIALRAEAQALPDEEPPTPRS